MASVPIVDGLEKEFADLMVQRLRANDQAEGQAAFAALALRGHPSVVLFDAAGVEQYRQTGLVDEDALREQIEKLLQQKSPG